MGRSKSGKSNGKVVGIWVKDATIISSWERYAQASGLQLTDFYCNAISEYIENHPLSDEMIKRYNNELLNKLIR